MRFSDIHTDKGLTEVLVRMSDEGRIPHAILLHENSGGGALATALAFVGYVACKNKSDGDSCGVCPTCNKISKLIHPDLHFVFPVANPQKQTKEKITALYYLSQWREAVLANPYLDEESLYKQLGIEEKVGMIKVDEAKSILEILNKSSYEGGNKYMIIWMPERMNSEAANKLLKILEEPFAGTIFLLVSQAPEKIISTIRSRTLQLRVHPIDRKEIALVLAGEKNISPAQAENFANLSDGSYGKALQLCENHNNGQDNNLILIESLIRSVKERKLSPTFPIVKELSEMGRENQRRFCLYAEDYLRKLYMFNTNRTSISYASAAETESLTVISKGLSDKFFTRAFSALERALQMLESNVNAKILFTSLVNRLFVSV